MTGAYCFPDIWSGIEVECYDAPMTVVSIGIKWPLTATLAVPATHGAACEWLTQHPGYTVVHPDAFLRFTLYPDALAQ